MLLDGVQLAGVQKEPLNLLVLCTGNSARSIMAEALFNHLGGGRLRAYSAGSTPTGRVNPYVQEQIDTLLGHSLATRSKSWDEFTGEDGPLIDIIVAVCANAAEACPRFPGAPEYVHWALPDPAVIEGDPEKIRAAFRACFEILHTRIATLLCEMPPNSGRIQMAEAMRALGER
jgi:arsenate reductase